jgi:hypothetical protein
MKKQQNIMRFPFLKRRFITTLNDAFVCAQIPKKRLFRVGDGITKY